MSLQAEPLLPVSGPISISSSASWVAHRLVHKRISITQRRPVRPSVVLVVFSFFMFCTPEFYVLLTVHPGTTLGKWPTWCTIKLYNTLIIIILYMFRATLCSSSGGQIVLIQHLISSHSVSDRPVCRLRRNLHTGRLLTEYDDIRSCINTIWPPDADHRFVQVHTGRSLTESTTPDAVLIQFDLLMMSTDLLEHAEDYNNKRII